MSRSPLVLALAMLASTACTDLPACDEGDGLRWDGEAWQCEPASSEDTGATEDTEDTPDDTDDTSDDTDDTGTSDVLPEPPVCDETQVLTWDGEAWACRELGSSTGDPAGLPECSDSQVMYWSGTSWVCGVVVFGDMPFIDRARFTLTEFAESPDVAARRGAASNPNLSPELQLALAGDADGLVRNFLIGNPSTVDDVLISLLPPAPDDYFDGVATAMAKHPNASPATLEAILATRACNEAGLYVVNDDRLPPQALLDLLDSDLSCALRTAAAARGQSEAYYQQIATKGFGEAGYALLQHPTLPSGVIATLHQWNVSTWRSDSIEVQIAAHSNTPETIVIELLATSTSRSTLRAILGRADAQVAWFEALDQRASSNASLDQAFEAPSNAPPGVLRNVAARSPSIAAAHPNTPSDLYAAFAVAPSTSVRSAAASNPAMDVELLAALAGDSVTSVRAQAAKHPHTPAAALGRIYSEVPSSQYEAKIIVQALARNTRLPEDLLLEIIEDVRSGRWTFGLSGAEHNEIATGATLAALASLPTLEFSSCPDDEYRRVAAQNPATPLGLLEPLFATGAPCMLSGVAARPDLTETQLRSLAEHTSGAVGLALARRTALPDSVARLLASHPNSDVRAQVIARPDTPADLLDAAAEDPSSQVRAAAARRTLSTMALTYGLAYDTASSVRIAAVSNPDIPLE